VAGGLISRGHLKKNGLPPIFLKCPPVLKWGGTLWPELRKRSKYYHSNLGTNPFKGTPIFFRDMGGLLVVNAGVNAVIIALAIKTYLELTFKKSP
jgi:hypothetical protein